MTVPSMNKVAEYFGLKEMMHYLPEKHLSVEAMNSLAKKVVIFDVYKLFFLL